MNWVASARACGLNWNESMSTPPCWLISCAVMANLFTSCWFTAATSCASMGGMVSSTSPQDTDTCDWLPARNCPVRGAGTDTFCMIMSFSRWTWSFMRRSAIFRRARRSASRSRTARACAMFSCSLAHHAGQVSSLRMMRSRYLVGVMGVPLNTIGKPRSS